MLVYVGRIAAEKGVGLLPEIARLVRERHADARLLVVGSAWFGETTTDPYVRRVWSEARESGAIDFTGFLPYDRVPFALAAADVLIAPGQWEEPFGRFAIEAMAACVPLVTASRGGTTQVAADEWNALVVEDFRRPEAYAGAVGRVLSDDALRERLVRHGRTLVERRYTWDRTARSVARVYDSLLSG